MLKPRFVDSVKRSPQGSSGRTKCLSFWFLALTDYKLEHFKEHPLLKRDAVNAILITRIKADLAIYWACSGPIWVSLLLWRHDRHIKPKQQIDPHLCIAYDSVSDKAWKIGARKGYFWCFRLKVYIIIKGTFHQKFPLWGRKLQKKWRK